MNPFYIMEEHKAEFTQNDLKIYQAILDNPINVVHQTTSEFAAKIDVSQPALTRFIQTLGYRKYNDFRADLASYEASQRNRTEDNSSVPYFVNMRALLTEAEKLLTKEYLSDLTEYILKFPRIFITGMGKSYYPALLMQNLLRKYGIFVNTTPLDGLMEVTDNMLPEDLLIIFSVSATSMIIDKINDTDGKILLITANPASEQYIHADRRILLPYLPPDPEACSISPVLFSMLVELLDAYIGEQLSNQETGRRR
jgi:RpiR family carbohydrate utilization transcriptional regulator